MLKKLRIRTQIFIAVACILAAMLVILYSLSAQSSRLIVKNNDRYTEDAIRKFKLGLSRNVDEVGQIMLNLAFDPFVQKFLTQNDRSLEYEMGKELDRKIISLKAGRTGFEDIVLIGYGGTRYSLNGGLEYARRLEKDIAATGGIYASGFVPFVNGITQQTGMVFAQNIYADDLAGGAVGKRIGYIAVIANVDDMFLGDKTESEPGVSFYLIDRNGDAYPELRSPDASRILETLSRQADGTEIPLRMMDTIGGVQGTVRIEKLDQMEGAVLSFVPEEALLSELNNARTRSVLIAILALLLTAIPFGIILNNIIHPIQILARFINGIKSGNIQDLKQDLRLEGNVEMNVVGERFNGMLGEINNLTDRLVETETHLLKSEIEKEKAATAYLRSQINPHFLYNTLESIKGVALEAGSRQVVDMTKALGKLFQYSVKGPGIVPLEQELNAVQSYVFLQLIRFEGRFEVEYDFTEEALRTTVMRMILQPIVENAIFHGLEPKTSKGLLRISGSVDEANTLTVRIEDDGIGVDAETLERIRGGLLAKPSGLDADGAGVSYDGSIGIANVHNRLKLAYGPAYGLAFDSEADKGTRITLTMPAGAQDRMQGGDLVV
ncbi:sensor histidine kinase [Cohnella sp. GCM10027633]|uniref:sensor histidine kinase n=1 Tax=unclassified Cohnella TaxID=2636738 RepID=UPI00362E0F25